MIVYQKFIHREDLKRNANVLYLFGDNNERQGFGGQAKQMRGEPNAVGIRTKWSPDMHTSSFFYDHQEEGIVEMIDEDFIRVVEHLETGGLVVVPSDGLGTGLSSLPDTAPKIFKWLEEYIVALGEKYGTYA